MMRFPVALDWDDEAPAREPLDLARLVERLLAAAGFLLVARQLP